MRKKTVKKGLNLIIAGVVTLILATFFHGNLADILNLSPSGEASLVFMGFLLGGMAGCLGIVITVAGLASSAGKGTDVRLGLTLLILVGALFFYFFLFYDSLTTSEPPRLRPGETINI